MPKGWFGDPDRHSSAGKRGAAALREKRGVDHFREIGRKGGIKTSADRDHMAEIGRKGGRSLAQDRDHMVSISRKGLEARRKDSDSEGGDAGT
jgi:general stress protein YciG